ncbi:hypothetical protein ACTXKZ_11410 [Brachybacterium alimentarium]|uniref:hypothetical protein n=1 Tax=Brachybacterium alimentarium TaxID=47845 RepID=UPI003FD1D80E
MAALASPSWADGAVATADDSEGLPQLTVDEWREVQAATEAAGDTEAAEAAEYGKAVAENQAKAKTGKLVVVPMLVPTLIKKAVKAALKYGGHKVPKPLRPYTNKILNVLDNTEAWEEAGLTTGFMAVGIPPDASQQAAHWIVVFVG